MNVRFEISHSGTKKQRREDALLYWKNEGPEFAECEATSGFCHMVSNSFDIMNSRELCSSKPLKNAISTKTLHQYEAFTNKFTHFIENFEFFRWYRRCKIKRQKRKQVLEE